MSEMDRVAQPKQAKFGRGVASNTSSKATNEGAQAVEAAIVHQGEGAKVDTAKHKT